MFVTLLLVAAVIGPGIASAVTRDFDGFHWEGAMKAGQAIEIKNIFGSIRAEPSEGNRVEVVASRPGTNFVVTEDAHGVSIRAVQGKASEGDVKVDFSVRVPRGIRFVGRTVNGSVEANALLSDAEAYTVNGDVRMSTAGEGEAATVNGSIVASMGAKHAFRNLKFSSVNGGITLHLPRCWNTALQAGTRHGEVASDVPLSKRPAPNGQPAVQLTTVNGNIVVRRDLRL